MDLRSAITRAARFCDDKSAPALQIEPEVRDHLGNLYRCAFVTGGQGGRVQSLEWLDPGTVVPRVAVDAAMAKKAVSEFKKGTLFGVTLTAYGTVTFSTGVDGGAMLHVPGVSIGSGAWLPPWPERYHPFSAWRAVQRVLHAVSKDDMRPELHFVKVTKHHVEGSDECRVARVGLGSDGAGSMFDAGRDVIVHKDFWGGWPKRKDLFVSGGVRDNFFFAYVDGEVRWTEMLAAEKFYDLSSKIPASGYEATVPRMQLSQAVKFATTAAEADRTELIFQDGKLHVAGLVPGARVSEAVLEAPGASDVVRVVVRGRLLWDALAEGDCDFVTLRYAAPDLPLVVVLDGGLSEAVWPLVQQAPPPVPEKQA